MLFLPPEGGNLAVQDLDRPPLGHNRDSTSAFANRNTCRPGRRLAMRTRHAYRHTGMTYASVNGLQLYYETHGSGRPLVLLHGGLLTIDLNFGPLLEPLAATGQVIAVELQGHGHTADNGRPFPGAH